MEELAFDVRPLSEVLDARNLSGQGSLVEQVYAVLRASIINLSLPPDSALVEQEVAGVLEVSKTPVREAIIRLAREGLVHVAPKSGSFVTPISLDRYFEACFVRTQLEVGCVRRLAGQGISMADQVRLRALITEQKAARRNNDDAGFFQLDEALHQSLFDIAGLSGVWQLMTVAKAEIDRVRHLKRAFGIRHRKKVIEEHSAIVDAVIEGDPARAEQALLNNIGAVDDEMASMSANPLLLRTIEDLNKLVTLSRRPRGSKRVAKA
ncbi:MAG: GntR family transcriptional regulator [Woeseia sp.]